MSVSKRVSDAMEIAVLGKDEFLLGFRMVGIRKVFPLQEETAEEEIETRIKDVMEDPDVGILVIHYDTLDKVSSSFRRKITDAIRPVVITIGEGEKTDLREKVKRAIGVDLYKSGG